MLPLVQFGVFIVAVILLLIGGYVCLTFSTVAWRMVTASERDHTGEDILPFGARLFLAVIAIAFALSGASLAPIAGWLLGWAGRLH